MGCGGTTPAQVGDGDRGGGQDIEGNDDRRARTGQRGHVPRGGVHAGREDDQRDREFEQQ